MTAVGRGGRPAPAGASTIAADRREPGALEAALDGLGSWDLVVDCAAFEARDVDQVLEVLGGRSGHLVLISSDAVFDPETGRFPRHAEERFVGTGYGGAKRACELALFGAEAPGPSWTILRPTHVYGPGSQLGCQPWHLRDPELLARLRSGEPLSLVAAGNVLQQPIYVDDLARLALDCPDAGAAHGRAFLAVGPEMVEAREYFRIVAEEVGVELVVEEASLGDYASRHPDMRFVLAHRAYGDQTRVLRAAGLTPPATPLADGLRRHVRYLLNATS